MLEEIVKSVIFLVLLALGGHFFLLFRRKHWFVVAKDPQDLNADSLQIVNRLPIGSRQYLVVVRCNQQKFLIGVSPSVVTSIGEIRSVEGADQGCNRGLT
ncbi:MAG: flagellar biosynthetic protein FliO [Puniceicoccales bacterium]|jgi:flagellar biogenesis protein FliO|nr:flagellar biosynthetic protein FliO [Puniceicoccales bacterium]